MEFYLSIFIVSPMLGFLASLLLMPLVVIGAAAAHLGDVLGFILGISSTIFLNPGLVIRLVCALLAGDGGQFIGLLPDLLDWVRSLGLL